MTKIEVLGSKGLLQGTLDVLQEAGVVHLSEAPLQDAQGHTLLERPSRHPDTTDPAASDTPTLERIAERLGEMSRAIPTGALDSEENRAAAARTRDELQAAPIEALQDRTAGLYDAYRASQRQVEGLQGERQVLERYQPAFEALAALIGRPPTAGTGPSPTEEPHQPRRAIVMDAGAREALAGLADILEILTDGEGALYRAPVEGGRAAVLMVYPERFDDRIAQMLGDEGIEELQLPVAYREMNLLDAATHFSVRLKEMPGLIGEAVAARDAFLSEKAPQIKGLLAQVAGRLSRSRQTDNLAVSERAFLLTGYVPRNAFDELSVTIGRELQGRVAVTDLGIGHHEEDQVPTQLRNRGFFKDFEVLLALLPPAKYGTVDATPLIAIGFPIFFGLMLGDIMYGLLVIAMGLGLKYTLGRRNRMIAAGGTVLLVCGISTTLFGIFFGEFGGNMQLGLNYLVYDRHHDLQTALYVVLGMGWVHIQFGLLLNMLKHFRHGHVRHGLAQIGFMLALCGLLVLVLMDQGALGAAAKTPMLALVGAGILLIVYGEGTFMAAIMGVLHILSYAGNIFSYARLMAIGLASVMLAIVANSFVQTGNIVGVIVGLFAAVFFHALNFALGVFGPSIHSLRLHYVEFFGKFYEPQGTVFEPFRKIGGEEV